MEAKEQRPRAALQTTSLFTAGTVGLHVSTVHTSKLNIIMQYSCRALLPERLRVKFSHDKAHVGQL